MKKLILYVLTILQILPLLACQKIKNETQVIDNNSYIKDFELSQMNTNNDTIIKISSPRAIIDPYNNDIEIFDNLIKILNKNGQDVQVNSGNSSLNSSANFIRVFNNVNISLLKNKNYFVTTDSFTWDLNSSIIDLNSPLDMNFDNTKITSSNGSYDISSGLLIINDNIFNRSVFDTEGRKNYQLQISSDMASWFKNENILEFTSKNKQVETTIHFLSIK